MKITFDLSDKLVNLAKSCTKETKRLRKSIDNNARIACYEAEKVIKSKTPNSDDGKRRGFNMISNSLQESWKVTYKPKSKQIVGVVDITNKKDYAKYVQEGHKMKKHFVPWLYKDGSGTLSYETNHSQPLFGLVVGTKTHYVKGVDMVGPGIKKFNDVFDKLNLELFNNLNIGD